MERFGPYQLLKLLGSGSMGDAHLARPLDRSSGLPSPLVIKRMHEEFARRDSFLRRFRHEAQIATLIDSPHVARTYDVGRVGDALYIAMEYISGWALSRIARSLAQNQERASVGSAVEVVAGGLLGLAAIHGARDPEGTPLAIVHRDISPKNLMVGDDGLTRVIDLGLGKSRMQDWKTQAGALMGTVGYMSPEQVSKGEVDHRADLYAMGIILWELLTGEPYILREAMPKMLLASAAPAFRPAWALRREVPRELDDVIRKALARDPAERFQSAQEFHDALRRVPITLASEERREKEPLTLVGHMLWGELSDSRVEMWRLLESETEAPPPEPADDQTSVFARRAPSQAAAFLPSVQALPEAAAAPSSSPAISAPPPNAVSWASAITASAPVTATATATANTQAEPAEGSRLLLIAAAFAAAIIVFAVSYAFFMPRAKTRAPSVPEAARIAPAPGVSARPREREPERVEPVAVESRPEVEATPTEAKPRRVARASKPAVEAAPKEEAPVPVRGSGFDRAPGESPRAWVDRLSGIAQSRLARAQEGSPERTRLERILFELTRHRASKRLDQELDEIQSLARELGPE